MRTLSLSKPHLIVMVGIPGSGKSFFAKQFADTFSAPLVSFEHLRNELFVYPTHSSDEQTTVAKVASHMINELFKTRQSIVFDGFSAQRTDRSLLTKVARDAGYEALFVWVQTELASAKQRSLKAKDGNKLTASQFDTAVKSFTAPHVQEKSVVISGKHTYASQLKNVLKRLAEPRSDVSIQKSVPKRPASSGRSILIR